MEDKLLNKLLFIESLESKNTINDSELSSLLSLSSDDDEEVRYRSIEVLGLLDSTPDILNAVRKGLSDEDELVRVECAEILGSHSGSSIVKDLVLLLEDESTLVRSAALVSLGEQGDKKVVGIIIDRLEKFNADNNADNKVAAAAALYMLGDDDFFAELLKGLSDDYYGIRCATANLLSFSIKTYHMKEALEAIENAMIKESSLAALSTFIRVLKDIKEV